MPPSAKASPSVDRIAFRFVRFLLGDERAADFLSIALMIGAFLAVDRLVARLSKLSGDAGRGSVLVWGAIGERPVEFAVVVGWLLVGSWRHPFRMWSCWGRIENGTALRLFAAPLIVILCWRHGFFGYNYVLDQWHLLDRVLVVGLGAAALWRAGFLIPFVAQTQIVGQQFEALSGLTSGRNIDSLPLLVLLAIAVGHARFVTTGNRRTAPIVLLITAIVASFFFHPGISKLRIGWIGGSDLSNFPLAAYSSGWLGAGDGGWSRTMAEIARTGRVPIMAATLVLEIGAIVAALHHRLLRWWLPGWAAFHVAIFAWTGFWLFEWVVVEGALFVMLSRSGTGQWLAENRSPARILLALVLVVGAPLFYNPPRLAWFDAPVDQSYRVEVTGESGTEYTVAARRFEPIAADISFLFVNVGQRRHVVGAYGAAFSKANVEELEALSDLADLDEYRAGQPEVGAGTKEYSEDVFTAFFDHVNERGDSPWWLIEPPPRFWNSARSPSFDFRERVAELRVYRIDTLHSTDQRRSTLELVVSANRAGLGVVIYAQ